jgi:hypothetical protein
MGAFDASAFERIRVLSENGFEVSRAAGNGGARSEKNSIAISRPPSCLRTRSTSSQFRNPEFLQVGECRVVESGQTSRIALVTRWDEDNHALTSAG